MEPPVSNSLSAIGFLTVVEDELHGFFGGYLLLSPLGRPLEFHCSTPILPSQAQKILYGSTLRSYVLGELIGQTLVQKAKLPVQTVLTDLDEMLSLALCWDGNLACVSSNSTPGNSPSTLTNSIAPRLDIDGYRVTGSATCRWSSDEMRSLLEPFVAYVDLAEPFDRIREAIQEAQRVSEPAPSEVDNQSAAA